MEKISLSQILIKGVTLEPRKLDGNCIAITNLIDNTKQKQNEILKLKNVDQDRLRLVVQL